MTGDVVLRADAVVKEYGSGAGAVRAVDGVTLDVGRGRLVSVMGPSGSGKSTLLHLFGGLDTPTSGDIWFEGQRLSALADRERTTVRRDRVGFVFQQFNLIAVLSAEENVALPLLIARTPPAERRRRIAEVLELVDLGPQRHRLPGALSGGEQQRVAIARALVVRPSVLLADEPTGNLDSATGSAVLHVMRDAQRELGQTVVLATHDARVAATGNEVVRLRDGKVVEQHAVRRRRGTARRQLDRLLDEEPSEV